MSYQHQYIDGTPIHFPLGKLVCVGRNYAEHAKELNNPVPTEPLLFIKPGSCVVPVSGGLSLPQERGSVHYEAEIAVLIGKPLSRKPNREEVLDAISGYAPALDLTLREVQAKLKEKGLPWELAKSFDGAGVLSPFVNADQFPDPTDIGIRLTINGEVRQDGNSRDMLNPDRAADPAHRRAFLATGRRCGADRHAVRGRAAEQRRRVAARIAGRQPFRDPRALNRCGRRVRPASLAPAAETTVGRLADASIDRPGAMPFHGDAQENTWPNSRASPMSLASKLPRFRWLLPAFVVLVGVVLTIVMHWDDRAGLWWKESQASQQQRDESIWLPGYRVVIDAKPLQGLEEEETSDLAYNPATRTLFTVTGKRPLLVELSLTGDVLRTIPLLGLSNPEGVAVLENGNVAVTDERRNTLTIFHVDPQTAELSTKSLAEFPLGNIGKKNKGFEGIAWDPRQQRLLLSKERDPMTLFSWKSDGGPSLSGAMTALPSDDLYMRNVSALSVDPRTGHTLVLSAESHLLLELDEKGEPVSFISLLGGFNGLDSKIPRAEGVAIDDEGTIYMVSEPNLFYVFRKKSGERLATSDAD